MKTRARILTLLTLSLVACNPVRITDLRCDYQTDPLAMDSANPQFGWRWSIDTRTPRGRGPHSARTPRAHAIAEGAATQSAYAIEVLDAAGNPIWQSGRIESGSSQHILYEGDALLPGKDYRWRVQVWDERGKAHQPTPWARFRTTPDPDWLDAKWIGAITRADSHLPEGRTYEGGSVGRNPEWKAAWAGTDPLSKRSILLRKEFPIKRKIAAAYAYVSGLGHYELFLNGTRVASDPDAAPDQVFTPLWSDYDKTVYYNVYDVTYLRRCCSNCTSTMPTAPRRTSARTGVGAMRPAPCSSMTSTAARITMRGWNSPAGTAPDSMLTTGKLSWSRRLPRASCAPRQPRR